MARIRIGYSTTTEVKEYIDKVAEQYNMNVSAVITMIVMQHKFQNETLAKVETLNSIVSQMGSLNKPDDNQQFNYGEAPTPERMSGRAPLLT